MRLTARARANRENAKKSRGPISDAGKIRSSRNAFRHGFATPVLARPGASQRVRDLADCLAGAGADEKLMDLARKAAEALADIETIETRKVALLSRPWLRFVRDNWRVILQFVKVYADAFEKFDEVENIPKPTIRDRKKQAKAINFIKTWSTPSFVHEQEIDFSEVADELKKLERYERRAFSRMIKTLRALDQAKAECILA